MKKLKFEPNLVPKILSGEKTSIWRLFDDKDLNLSQKSVVYASAWKKQTKI